MSSSNSVYPDLSNKIIVGDYIGRYLGLVPMVYAMEGSVVQKIVFGFTKNHALARAKKYLKRKYF